MTADDAVLGYMDGLSLLRSGDDRPAGLWITSLPLPRGAAGRLTLGGRPTHSKLLGRWPDGAPAEARRLLLIADAAGEAPPSVALGRSIPAPRAPLPDAEMEMFAHSSDLNFYWERHMLKIAWNGPCPPAGRRGWVGLAMGMRVHGEVHWWEYCNLVTVGQSEACCEIEMGGAIPHELTTTELFKQFEGRDNPYLHKHNWLNGHIYARLHANGVCEVFARHVNSMFFDDGADLKDAVPVVGIRAAGDEEALRPLCGAWDGSRDSLDVGGVQFDLSDAAHLASREQPGSLDLADGFLVWQPYQGVELYGGRYAKLRTGDDYIMRAEQHVIPRGMARTLRFSLSLAQDRPPRVARYLAPAWWYGVCQEFLPEPLLPVSNQYDAPIDSARLWLRKYMLNGGFCDGEIPNGHTGDPKERHTPATEGDVAGALFLAAYRTGDPADYDCAMRASYFFTDVCVDHAVKRVRMQDFTPPAVALPLQRVHSCLAAFLETGDLFCLNAARAVVETSYWWHKNSWPRRAVGRDACFVHGAMFLYRYLGDRHFLELARDAIQDLGASQWPDGTFGDQGGGAGIHGYAAYIVKPWMGWMATMGVLDYLEHFPDDADALAIVTKFTDWLMKERAARNDGKAIGWTYQHVFKGKERPGAIVPEGPTTGKHLFHFDYIARLLPYMSFRTGDPAYFDAFAQSYEGMGPARVSGYGDCAATLYFLPWLQAKLWNAQLDGGSLTLRPVSFGPLTPKAAHIHTPRGPVEVEWTAEGSVVGPDWLRKLPDGSLQGQLPLPTA